MVEEEFEIINRLTNFDWLKMIALKYNVNKVYDRTEIKSELVRIEHIVFFIN